MWRVSWAAQDPSGVLGSGWDGNTTSGRKSTKSVLMLIRMYYVGDSGREDEDRCGVLRRGMGVDKGIRSEDIVTGC